MLLLVDVVLEVLVRHSMTASGMVTLQSEAISCARVTLRELLVVAKLAESSQRQVEVSLEERVLLRGVQHSGPAAEVLPTAM